MKKLTMIAALAALLTACTNVGNEQNGEFNFEEFYAEFQSRRAAWENLRIDHYRYTLFPSVVMPLSHLGGLTITVFPDERGPEITKIGGRPIDEWPPYWAPAEEWNKDLGNLLEWLYNSGHSPLTITQLFSVLERDMLRIQHAPPVDDRPPFPVRFEATYNERYHFPEFFSWRLILEGDWGCGSFSPHEITNFEDLRGR